MESLPGCIFANTLTWSFATTSPVTLIDSILVKETQAEACLIQPGSG